jgi:ATP-dependent helicase/nuclease subunit B
VNLYHIAPGRPFLDAIARHWLAQHGAHPADLARGLILLPTRRAARALAESFLRAGDGRPMLLPRIAAIGALDEAPLALAGALTLPPSVDPVHRLAVLTRMILHLKGDAGAPRTADRAWLLAEELAALMDEAERAEIDLAQRLPDAADPAYAAHWHKTLEFLAIVTRNWPHWLAGQGLMNPAARQVQLLDAQAASWTDSPPQDPVLVAGTIGGMPALGRLLVAVARLKHGAVLLPGLDTSLDEAAWEALDETHPQFGLRRLLASLGARRQDVQPFPGGAADTGRAELLSHALLPAPHLGAWQRAPVGSHAGLRRLEAGDQQEEAAAIAMVLRGAVQQLGTRAALVTPDRALATRVSAELLRHGVVADDSAGEDLAQTPPAVFLRLLAEAVIENLAPVPLLALLKHPFTALRLSPREAREAARSLELCCLRGQRPTPCLAGLRRAVHRAGGIDQPAAEDLLRRFERAADGLLRLTRAVVVPPADLFAALIAAAEALATTDESPGPQILWAQEEGEALATRLAEVQSALPVLEAESPACLPGLLRAVLSGVAVRSRRALRGREGFEHPRVFIWGLLEARLQAVDVMVLGGLVEGVWPVAADPGPWLSRPMRKAIGLPSPEEQVGLAAHDFVMSACAGTDSVLSCPRRRDGAPAVPARWLVRLEACLAGRGDRLAAHPAAWWARGLDQPAVAQPVAPPRPCPPLAVRPRQFRVTEIEMLLRDPYAIYARHILKLRPLDPIDQSADAADYGTLVHEGLRRFLEGAKIRWPADAREQLLLAMDQALVKAELRPALLAWWRPRLARIAAWVAQIEIDRRSKLGQPQALEVECDGVWKLAGFELRGRADRIELRADGRLAILDYKTGAVPSQLEVENGLAPQLPAEAAMALAGAFGEALARPAGELTYWHLTGGFRPGELHTLFKGKAEAIEAVVEDLRERLPELLGAFDDPARAYLAQPHPAWAPRFSDYAQLARLAEWAAGEEG